MKYIVMNVPGSTVFRNVEGTYMYDVCMYVYVLLDY